MRQMFSSSTNSILDELSQRVGTLRVLFTAIFDPALLDLEVAIAKNVVYFPRNE